MVRVPLVVRGSFPSGTRDVFQKCKKSICFHRNSHTEKCSNVKLVSVHFLLLLNCNTFKFVTYCIMLHNVKWAASLLGAFFLSATYPQQQEAATQSNILASVLHNISSNELTTGFSLL